METKGTTIVDGKLEVSDVINRLKAMRPYDKCPEFDEAKYNDHDYCIAWGEAKRARRERKIYDKYINDLLKVYRANLASAESKEPTKRRPRVKKPKQAPATEPEPEYKQQISRPMQFIALATLGIIGLIMFITFCS